MKTRDLQCVKLVHRLYLILVCWGIISVSVLYVFVVFKDGSLGCQNKSHSYHVANTFWLRKVFGSWVSASILYVIQSILVDTPPGLKVPSGKIAKCYFVLFGFDLCNTLL